MHRTAVEAGCAINLTTSNCSSNSW